MGRSWTWMILGISSIGIAGQAFAHEPRGRTFSQGGGWRHAPREHHTNVRVPGWYSYNDVAFGGFGFGGPGFGVAVGAPVWGYGYPAMYGTVVHPGYYLPYPITASEMPNSPMQAPPDALPTQRNPWDQVPGPKTDPALNPVIPSSAAARLRGLNYQVEGDQNLRQGLWQRAYVNYRQAVNVADDLAEAHLRYGITLAMLNRFDQAAREFRRAVHIDPSLPTSEFNLATLFGPESRLVRNSLVSRVTAWANEDVTAPERLFVLAVLLHYEGDERSQELFSAIVQMTEGDAQYAVVFLPRVDGKQQPGDAIPLRPDDNAALPPAPLPPAPRPEAAPRRTAPAPPKPLLNGPATQPSKKNITPPTLKPDADGPVLLPPTPE